MQHTLYHSLLRVFAAVFAFVLLFDSGFLSPATKQLSSNAQQYMGNVVGVYASVPPTEINEVTAALTEQKVELEAREQALAEREITISRNDSVAASAPDTSTFLISVTLFILLVLIILNYGLDYTRMRRELRFEKNEAPA